MVVTKRFASSSASEKGSILSQKSRGIRVICLYTSLLRVVLIASFKFRNPWADCHYRSGKTVTASVTENRPLISRTCFHKKATPARRCLQRSRSWHGIGLLGWGIGLIGWVSIFFPSWRRTNQKKKQTFPHCKSWIRMLYTNHGKIRCGSESTWSRSASSITGTSLFLRSNMVTKKAKQTPHPQNVPPVAPNFTWKTPGKLRGGFPGSMLAMPRFAMGNNSCLPPAWGRSEEPHQFESWVNRVGGVFLKKPQQRKRRVEQLRS